MNRFSFPRAFALFLAVTGIASGTGCSLLSAGGRGSSASSASGGDRPLPCDNAAFAALQNRAHAHYTEVTVCGIVTRTLRERVSRSGRHKYFFVRPSGLSRAIEIVVNVDETGEFAVVPGDRANVHGRFYDDGDRKGIDWTHHNDSRPSSWPYPGYVQIDGGRLVN